MISGNFLGVKLRNIDDEINEEEEEDSEETASEETDVSTALAAAINNINYW